MRARTFISWWTLVTSGQHGVDDDAAAARPAAASTSGAEPCAESMSGAPGGTSVDVVDEDHALAAELLDDEAVVDDLVVAVDGRLEDADHPGERLDRHLDAGAEAPRLGEQDVLDPARPAHRDGYRAEVTVDKGSL